MSAPADERLSCHFCGLPLRPSWWSPLAARPSGEREPQYCCYGCRFAAAVTQTRGEQGEANWALTRLGLAIFFTMNVLVFSMALWTEDVYDPAAGSASPLGRTLPGLFRYLCLLFALPVLWLLGGPLLDNAWRGLRSGSLSTDLLLLLGVAASYLYSAISVFRDHGRVYFEVGCMVLVLVTLGRWLEATGKLKTGQAIESLHKLLPDTVRVVRDVDEQHLALHEVRVGDCLRVLPGERIPCDGRIVRGRAAVDEQVLTGESSPRLADAGALVFSGSLNLDGELVLSATASPRGGALARLIDLVQAARQSRGHFERLGDRAAAWFLPGVMLIALGAFTYHGSRYGLEQGILTGLAVVLIACPCALGLATPLAVWTALGQAARVQVLFRNGEALERLAQVRAVRFDKTGTLTTGTARVVAFAAAEETAPDQVWRQAARLAAASTHGHAVAIRQFVEQSSQKRGLLGPADSQTQEMFPPVRTLPGRGLMVETRSSTGSVFLGSLRLMEENDLAVCGRVAGVLRKAQAQGQPVTCIGWQGRVHGTFVFEEQMRPEARQAVAQLRQQGLDVAVLTGDHRARGAALAQELAISVQADLSPEDKVAAVVQAQQAIGPVAMVGDGINDAPALARSDVGIAMGCGADVSRESAAVCLLGNDLLRLPWAITLARRTVCVIRQNLFWAFFYNILGISLACSGHLNPIVAAVAMVLSSFLVVTNSLRLSSEPATPLTRIRCAPKTAAAGEPHPVLPESPVP